MFIPEPKWREVHLKDGRARTAISDFDSRVTRAGRVGNRQRVSRIENEVRPDLILEPQVVIS